MGRGRRPTKFAGFSPANLDHPGHGTRGGYRLGCRCERCRAAKAAYERGERSRLRERDRGATRYGDAWSEADLARLTELYGTRPAPEVAKALGRTVGAVRNRAHLLGLTRSVQSHTS